MKTDHGLLRLAVWATLGLQGCSGSSPIAGGSDAGSADEPDAAAPAQIAGFDFVLEPGDYWDYGWREERTTFAITGSTDTKSSGELRLTLGAPVTISGLTAYPLVFSGSGNYVRGRWSYLALQDNVLYASSDGTTLEEVFNAQMGTMPGNGFFEDLGGALYLAAHGAISNDFMKDSDVYEISQSKSSSQCQYFPGVGTICGSSGSEKVVHEYYKAGIGPVGYSYYFGYSSGSGEDYFTTTTTKDVGLLLSSLRGDVASYVLDVEPNNRLDQAMALSPPVEVHGDGAWDDATVPPTVVPFNSMVENEPNDSAPTAQLILLPNLVSGDVAVADPGTTVTFPDEDGGAQVVQDWYSFTTTTAASSADPLSIGLDFSKGPQADLDVYLVDQGLTTILGSGNADNFTTKKFSESVRMTTLAPGTYFLLVVDFPNPSATPGARASYTLKVGRSSTPNDLSVTEWFSVALASPQRIVVDATSGWGVVILSGDSSRMLASAMPTVNAGGATATSSILEPGSYSIGLGKTTYAKTTAHTMGVSLASQ